MLRVFLRFFIPRGVLKAELINYGIGNLLTVLPTHIPHKDTHISYDFLKL